MSERARRFNRVAYATVLFVGTAWGGIGLLGLGAGAAEPAGCSNLQQAYLGTTNAAAAQIIAARLISLGCTVPSTSSTSTRAPSTSTSTSSTTSTSTSTSTSTTTSTSTSTTSTTVRPSTSSTSTTAPPTTCQLLTQAYLSYPAASFTLAKSLTAAGCPIPATTTSTIRVIT